MRSGLRSFLERNDHPYTYLDVDRYTDIQAEPFKTSLLQGLLFL
jgi:hypothetical protein